MLRPQYTRQRLPRRGIILLVVIALLTLFAVVGISFVLYSQQRTDAARALRESQQQTIDQRPNTRPEDLLNEFAAHFLFGQPENAEGIYSALRGHDLARNMYGYNSATTNTIPYNGVGRLHHTSTPFLIQNQNIDEYYLVNYTYFKNDNILHDPERFGWRQGNNPPGAFVGGFNAPYTYPDLNNMYLAVVVNDPPTPQVPNPPLKVILPSFHRPWTGFGALDPYNKNWYINDPNSKHLKYMVLRPRPAEHLGFPAPTDAGGDVRNLPGPGPNDSIWLDLNSAVKTLPDGRKYKPLFAPLIIDLDNRLNLNVAGNLRGLIPQPAGPGVPIHASNQGWGPWEVNLRHLNLNPANGQYDPAGLAEWPALFSGNSQLNPPVPGRYGTPDANGRLLNPTPNINFANLQSPNLTGQLPGSIGFGPLFNLPRVHSQVDFDSVSETAGATPTPPMQLPTPGGPSYFPTFQLGYGNGYMPYANPLDYQNVYSSPIYELASHPAMFNYFQPGRRVIQSPPPSLQQSVYQDRVFDVSTNLAPLMLLADNAPVTDVKASSDLGKLLPNNLRLASLRRMVTTLSFDLDTPGITPWIWDRAQTPYQMAAYDPATPNTWTPSGGAMSYPQPVQNLPVPPSGSEFGPDWRANALAQGFSRLDLSSYFDTNTSTYRPLPDYPPGYIGTNVGPTTPFGIAQAARQQVATNVFMRLVKLTGAYDISLQSAMGQPAPPAPTQQEFDALRWLAQLAVNMVDYIDSDDVMTPFNWINVPAASQQFRDAVAANSFALDQLGKGWVFGTELPRVVLNEAYAEIANDSSDATGVNFFNVNFWFELHNIFTNNSPGQNNSYPDPGTVKLQAPAADGNHAIYQVVVAPKGTNASYLRQNGNVFGDVNVPTPLTNYNSIQIDKLVVADYVPDPAQIIVPTLTERTEIAPMARYMLGPKDNFPNLAAPMIPSATLRVLNQTDTTLHTRSGMSYQLARANVDLLNLPTHTVLLRRLACPNLPPQTDFNQIATLGYFNPYITVDYLESLSTIDGVQTFNTAANVGMVGMTARLSKGRLQPFAGRLQQWKDQVPATPLDLQPQHTFLLPNEPRFNSYGQANGVDWLVHLDRQLINPMELLHVSGFKPHELTQQFMPGVWDTPMGQQPQWVSAVPPTTPPSVNQLPFGHRAPWFDPARRLYRFLEFVETQNRMAGMTSGGRIPGKININTVWDPQILMALCDPQPSNNFLPADIFNPQFPAQPNMRYDPNTLFGSLIRQRSPGLSDWTLSGTNQPKPTITANDRPFWSLAHGFGPQQPQFPTGLGIESTLLRSFDGQSGLRRLFELPDVVPNATMPGPRDALYHPYVKDELLTKVYNNLTTRSNVFAMWLTVGFFQVFDDTVFPNKLGPELGLAQGQNVRHHMFAIIDRSALTVPAIQQPNPLPQAMTGVSAGNDKIFDTNAALLGVQAGSIVTVKDVDQSGNESNPETVVITGFMVNQNNTVKIMANFKKAHTPGFRIYKTIPGNPGQTTSFDPDTNSALVPFYTILD